MSRTLVCSAFLLTAVFAEQFSLRADEPAAANSVKAGSGTLVLTGSNNYTGWTTITAGTLEARGNGRTFTVAPASGTYTRGTAAVAVPSTPAGQASNKVFYIITEGAGLGDSVRSIHCTGGETVLDAIGMINGISQVSDAKKMWIARPSAADRGKSTILKIHWEEISRCGINTTNYTLQPGDRLVLGEDALMKQANLISKKTAILERLMGVTSLTTSVVRSLDATPGGGAIVESLVRQGYFADDPEVNRLILELIRLQQEESKKAGVNKSGADQKPGP